MVLDVALRLGALLQDRLGSEVVYTRTDDTYIPLEERTRIANDHKADLFLSIHANSSPFKTAGGVETYYLNFTTTKTSLELAAKENAGSQSSIFDLKDVLAKIAMKDKIDESREFATQHPDLAVRGIVKEQRGGEEPRDQEGSVRGADRRVDAERAGGDRVPDQHGGRGAAAGNRSIGRKSRRRCTRASRLTRTR